MSQDKLNLAIRDAYLAEYPLPDTICPDCPPVEPKVWRSPVELVTEGDDIDVRDEGVPTDGTTAASDKLMAAMQKAVAQNKILYSRGVIKADKQIKVPSGLRWNAYGTTVIDAIPDVSNTVGQNEGAPAVYIRGQSNISIGGLLIDGKRNLTTKSEYNHGIGINGGEHIQWFDVTVQNANGDGFYIGALPGQMHTRHVAITNCRSINSCRNAGSLIDCDGFTSRGNRWMNSLGLDPQGGFDVEPDRTDNIVRGIVFEDDEFSGCSKGGGLSVNMKVGSTTQDHVAAMRCRMTKNVIGVISWGDYGLNLIDCLIEDNALEGIRQSGTSSKWRIFGDRIIGNGTNGIKILGPLTDLWVDAALLDLRGKPSDGVLLNAQVAGVLVQNTRIDNVGGGKLAFNPNGATNYTYEPLP